MANSIETAKLTKLAKLARTKLDPKKNTSDVIFDIVNYGFLGIVLVMFIYPLFFILSASVSDPNAVWNGKVWLLPKNISFEGYRRILANNDIWIGYKNTIIYTVTGTLVNLFMTFTAAYPLSRKDFLPRNFLMALYTFTMLFSGGLIPTYLIVTGLGMYNNIWAMIIPHAVAVWNIVITRTYFQTNIKEELREAAVLDGCSNTRFLVQIVLPLSTPIIGVMALFYGVWHWNSFFNALIYLSDREKYPLQLFLREILILSEIGEEMIGFSDAEQIAEQMKVAETVKYGVIIVASLPVLMIYPFVQNMFVKGIMVGSLKG